MFTQARVEKLLRRLAGTVDLEGALKKLDRLTQEEARMALAEVLRNTDIIRDGVKCVNESLQVIIDGAWGMSNQPPIPSNIVTFRRQGSKSGSAGNKIDDTRNGKRDRRSQVFVTSLTSLLLAAYALDRREPDKTALTSVALSRRSFHKSQ